MKILMTIAVLFAINFGSFSTNISQGNVDAESSLNSLDEQVLGKAFIIMEDIMTRANSGNPNNPVTGITIFDEAGEDVVFQSSGCGQQECTYNSSLTVGTYYAVANTEIGESFSDYITVE